MLSFDTIKYIEFYKILQFVQVVITIGPNEHVYETFGISKHFPVKLQLLLIRAEMFDNPLTAKCFIYDVGCRNLLYLSIIIYKTLLLNE